MKQIFFRGAVEQKSLKTTDLDRITQKTINMNKSPKSRHLQVVPAKKRRPHRI